VRIVARFSVALLLVLATGCPRTSGGGGSGRHAPITLSSSSGSQELRDDQASAEAGNFSDLLWGADTDNPSIWAFTGSPDYFIPRVGLRFVLPTGFVVDTSALPTQHLVLQGAQVPPVARGQRLYGDRTLRVRGDSAAAVSIVLLEIPMSVEPATFCAWVADQLATQAVTPPQVTRDESQAMAGSTTRVCEVTAGAATTPFRCFLHAGWGFALSQPVDAAGASAELDAIVASVRAFD